MKTYTMELIKEDYDDIPNEEEEEVSIIEIINPKKYWKMPKRICSRKWKKETYIKIIR